MPDSPSSTPPLTSSQPQPRELARLECCECAVPVAADGPQRAALLLPCQHVLHVSCVEFIKRRGKLLRMLSSDLESWLETLPAGHGNDLADSLFHPAVTFLCPGCQRPVDRIVPLFASGEAPRPSAAAVTAQSDFEETLCSQRRLIHRLRRLREQRESVNALGHQCAALHEQRARALREMDRYNRMFPGMTSADGGGAPAEAYQRMGVAPMSSLEKMGTTELELYLAEVVPLLSRTQAALRHERRAVQRRRAKLAAVRARYHALKEIAQLDKEIAAAQQQHRRENRGAPAGDADSIAERRDHQPFRESSRSLSMSLSTPQLRGVKRRREPTIIDVDAQLRPVVACRQPCDAIVVDEENEERAVDVDDEDASVGSTGSVAGRMEMVLASDTEPEEEEQGGHTRAGSEGSSRAGDIVAFQEDGEDTPTEPASPTGDDTADVLASMGLLPPGVAQRSRGRFVGGPAKLHANHVRMLPRREDRLWQPSLEF